MFQNCFVEFISILSDCFVGISALAIAFLGIVGLSQWKTELKGKAKFEIARQMAKTAFQFRDEVKRAQNVFTFAGESAGRKKEDNESLEEKQILDEFYARRQRLAPLQESLGKLYELGWEAELLLDKEINEYIKPLEKSFKSLYAAIESYFFTLRENIGKLHPVEINDNRYNMIYGIDDEFSQTVDKAVSDFTKKLKTYIK